MGRTSGERKEKKEGSRLPGDFKRHKEEAGGARWKRCNAT